MILKRAGKLPPDDLQNRPTRISWADRVGSGGMGALTSLPHPFLRGKGGGGQRYNISGKAFIIRAKTLVRKFKKN